MRGNTWISVPLYDEDDVATWHFVFVEWEYTTEIMGIGGDWTTEIVKFPKDLSEETKEQLRIEVHKMREAVMNINDEDDYEHYED